MSQKFNLIVADPPWSFNDNLTMSDVKRGAKSQYKSLLSKEEIWSLPISEISADDAILFLWVPSALLEDGLITLKRWGFELKQTFIWVKTKPQPEKIILAILRTIWKNISNLKFSHFREAFQNFDLNSFLSFYLGRIFRQTHEIALIGTKGKIYSYLKNHSQRSVLLASISKHSEKPEEVQNRLELLWPDAKKIELFARRDRNGWVCLGNECPSTKDEDIRVSLKKLI
jgi:N6-adenosine-specific RNA methylase IME4